MEGTERKESDKGTPQGGQISPVLANVYLHYVFDLWYEKALRRKCKGEVYYVRYADDFLLMFQYENEAEQVLAALKDRLGKFGLELAEDKTRILPIGRFKGTKPLIKSWMTSCPKAEFFCALPQDMKKVLKID
jgi:retron-type reverse transcriptase